MPEGHGVEKRSCLLWAGQRRVLRFGAPVANAPGSLSCLLRLCVTTPQGETSWRFLSSSPWSLTVTTENKPEGTHFRRVKTVLPLLSTEQRWSGRSSLEAVAVLLWELGFPSRLSLPVQTRMAFNWFQAGCLQVLFLRTRQQVLCVLT